ncbi:hypothetical protein Astex_2166 [Asticcacaulis excentricus CB 48]|uniref:Uncharacterized protein n=1 Tax=Asticcacaulis excentricus (strain ATCC 15261 / DSM 4724 / KCTC 12464 / NCIMB 9791 / VKM B-1370 / CB 48) TaxID=573065 RepID=E8RM05_ASTEC|nr:hypothetical protein Astex_2166 [Asticcacaulis excentricus CB 48]
MRKILFTCAAPVLALAFLSTKAVAQCPDVRSNRPGAPLLPAVTKVEIFNPTVPGKPHPAVPGSEQDRAQTTGGVRGKSSLTLIVTLSSEVASGCELPFSLYDATGSLINRFQPDTEKTFPRINGTSSSYLTVTANGSNKVELTLPVGIRLGGSRIQRHRLGLSTPYSGQTPETPVLFEFKNNPVRIGSIYRIGDTSRPASPGDRIEVAVTTAEPMDPASEDYEFVTSDQRRLRNRLFVRYTFSPTNLARLDGNMGDNPQPFAPNFADGSSRLPIRISAPSPTPSPVTPILPQKPLAVVKLPTRPTLSPKPQAQGNADAPQSVVMSAQLYTESTGEGGEILSLDIPLN